MGDSCSIMIFVWHEDYEKFEQHTKSEIFFEEKPSDEKWIEVQDDEVNYAAWTEMTAAAADGCRFYGRHGCGNEYDACEFVGFNGELLELKQHGNYDVVNVVHDGNYNYRVELETMLYLQKYGEYRRQLDQLK